MIVRTEQDLTCHDMEVLIRYAKMNQKVERLITLLQTVDKKIKCYREDEERYVNVSDIFYMESVDKRTFAYLEKNVFRTEFRLYQLNKDFAHLGFVQISKSCIVNINVLESIKPLANSRMLATLKNGEQLYVTRKYLNVIKQALQEGMEL